MSPRPYRLGQRQAATEQTRIRIIHACRELLMTKDGFTHFSMEMVAKQADVARMTVYHQFGSKTGLLEALCDSLAVNGGMEQMANVFCQSEPIEALKQYIIIFGRFWSADRLVTRRLRALADLDPEFEQVIRQRDERRRTGVRTLLARICEEYEQPSAETLENAGNVLCTLIGFETFDSLAGPERSPEDVTDLVYQLVLAALDRLIPDIKPSSPSSSSP
ncbi:TetR/AcrR family transcriptional regulator [Dictyobacter aurantiacus]|uniref:HTH tetR-type domain-containing protein n=1 Tax=Dictyobacter aurantiacus TaxID=1936993 RepID=A0A401ZSI9_9CHLR|nr:TetR/AcrR family transcriptional regulator [Dictyobacter aurantiacus]GCE09772.1 hypothetical protein KDAU_71010 [Dictyobacter aurantiacus]